MSLCLGVVPPNMFDQLQTASFIGGFNATIRSNMPAMSHYVGTGMEPFVAVYTAMEVTALSIEGSTKYRPLTVCLLLKSDGTNAKKKKRS